MYVHCESNKNPQAQADISHFRGIDQDDKQVGRETMGSLPHQVQQPNTQLHT